VFTPEVVVEVQIEEGAVHIEEDGIDVRPREHGKAGYRIQEQNTEVRGEASGVRRGGVAENDWGYFV
jgi:hypothetical protein